MTDFSQRPRATSGISRSGLDARIASDSASTPASISDDTGDDHSATEVKDDAKAVAQQGKQAAADVANTATDAAKNVAGETKDRAADLYAQTKSQLSDQVVSQKGALVEGLRSLGDQLVAMTDHVDESGTAVDAATTKRLCAAT